MTCVAEKPAATDRFQAYAPLFTPGLSRLSTLSKGTLSPGTKGIPKLSGRQKSGHARIRA
jgi:hypothetical protein